MVAKPSVGKTGNAQIKKAGHTSSQRDGSNPQMKERASGTTARDQGIR